MKNIIICDDDVLWLDRAADIINNCLLERRESDAVSLLCCRDISACMERVSGDTRLVFMDIELDRREDEQVPGDPDGIRAAAEINRKYPNVGIVYLTNYLSYALDVYDTDHIWYVLKEEFEGRLPGIFDKLERLENEKKKEITVSSENDGVVNISCSSILYIERTGRRTAIKTTEGIYTTKAKISDVMEILPKDDFARCHNSFIVNMAQISRMHRSVITMRDGSELLISRGYSREFRCRYMEWAKSRVF